MDSKTPAIILAIASASAAVYAAILYQRSEGEPLGPRIAPGCVLVARSIVDATVDGVARSYPAGSEFMVISAVGDGTWNVSAPDGAQAVVSGERFWFLARCLQ